jgi:hypothetical protein
MPQSATRSRRALTPAAAACLLLGLCANLAAQPAQAPVLRPGWTFTPSLTFGGAWDDNVLLVGSESQALLPDDYVTALSPAGTLDYYGRRLTLATGYRGSFVRYRELSELNSLDLSASVNLQYRWTPRLTVGAGQTYSSSRETDVAEFIGVPFSRIGNRRSTTQTSLDLRLSPHTTMNAGYALRVVDFDEADLAFPGGHEQSVSWGLQHQLSTRVSVGGTYGFRRMLVVDDPNPIWLHHTAGTTEYQVTSQIALSGSLGVSHVRGDADRDSQSGLAGRAALHARREHFTATAYYERSMLPSFGFGGTFHNEELAGSLQGGFARNRAYWQAGAAWRENDPLITDRLTPELAPSLRSVWLTSRVGYRVYPWLNLEGYVTQAYQDARRPGGKVERTRVGFQIVTSKPLRLAR